MERQTEQSFKVLQYSTRNTSAVLFHDSGWWTIVFHTFIKRNKKELLICSQRLWIRFYSSYRELSLDLIWYTVLWLENVNPTVHADLYQFITWLIYRANHKDRTSCFILILLLLKFNNTNQHNRVLPKTTTGASCSFCYQTNIRSRKFSTPPSPTQIVNFEQVYMWNSQQFTNSIYIKLWWKVQILYIQANRNCSLFVNMSTVNSISFFWT